MRLLYTQILLSLILGIFCHSPAVAAKIKHQATIYVDSLGESLAYPEGVACDANSIVVADTGNSQLKLYSLDAQGVVPKAVIELPESFPLITQIDSLGNVFFLDGKSRDIVKIGGEGQVQEKLEVKSLPGSKTYIPRSFRLDEQDNIYLLDIFAERVLVLKPTGEYLRQVPFPEGFRFFSDLEVSSNGAIFLLDSVAGAIYEAQPSAESFKLLSSNLKEFMNFPTRLAMDSKGAFYLADEYGSGLALVGRDGRFQGRKFGMGWEDGQLNYPAQICINPQDTLVIADRNNSRVQVFSILDE